MAEKRVNEVVSSLVCAIVKISGDDNATLISMYILCV